MSLKVFFACSVGPSWPGGLHRAGDGPYQSTPAASSQRRANGDRPASSSPSESSLH